MSTDSIPKTELHHIFKVLRAKKNTNILLLDGKGSLAEAEIIDKNTLNVVNIKKFSPPSKQIHLFVAPPKKNSMDIILKQAAEIGLASVNLLKTEHSVAIHNNVPERMETLLKEGCKQAHNPFLPTLCANISLQDFLIKKKEFDYSFFGSTSSCSEKTNNAESSKKTIPSLPHEANIAWLVGPEGGFSQQEEDILLKNNIQPLQIGKWVLRVETACLAGTVTLMN